MTRRESTYGLTLVELLVVLAIIGLMTAISVPVLSRMGLFGIQESDLAARELFAVMRGVQVHASTNNVETAIVYSVQTPIDSLPPGEYFVDMANDNNLDVDNPVDYRPEDNTGVILDAFMTVRRFTPEELLLVDGLGTEDPSDDRTLRSLLDELSTALPGGENVPPTGIAKKFIDDDNVFVALESRESTFRPFPSDTALLTNHPDALLNATTLASDGNAFQRETGLVPIFLVDVEINGDTDAERTIEVSFIEPRILYENRVVGGGSDPQDMPGDIDAQWDYQFPAHIFRPDGSMVTPDIAPKERLTLRIGPRPDAPVEERFLFNADTERAVTRFELDPTPFEVRNPNTDELISYTDLDVADDLVGMDAEIEVYVSSGRIKVTS